MPTISFFVTGLDNAFNLEGETTAKIIPVGIGRLAITLGVGLIIVDFAAVLVTIFYFFKGCTLATGISSSRIEVGITSTEDDIKSCWERLIQNKTKRVINT